jgi:hypothetical protein
MSAGKGDKPRPVDQKGWEESKLWDHIADKKRKQEKESQRKNAFDELSGGNADEQ